MNRLASAGMLPDAGWISHPYLSEVRLYPVEEPSVVVGPLGETPINGGYVLVDERDRLWPVSMVRLDAERIAVAAGCADVLDYSAGAVPPAVVLADWGGVIRYTGTPGSGKNLDPAEYSACRAAGVPIAFCYETTAGWMLGGRVAGVSAGKAVLADFARCGVQHYRAVYGACDTDITTEAQAQAVDACLDGMASVLGREVVGIYGEYSMIERCLGSGRARWGWQTRAWSGGQVSPHAHLLQQVGYVYPARIECDRSTVIQSDWGQYPGGDEVSKADADAAFKDGVTRRWDDAPAGQPDPATIREMLKGWHALLADVAQIKQAIASGYTPPPAP